jgi:cell wall-associated NlpC family hydrolase
VTTVEPDPSQVLPAHPEDPNQAISDATLHSVAAAAQRAQFHGVQDGGTEDGQAGDLIHLGADDNYNMEQLGKVQPKAEQPTTAAPTEGTGKGAEIVAAARSQLGVKYVYGAHQWGQALDCSGLTQGALAQVGIKIGGNTYTQVQQGVPVPDLAHAQPGDLVFTMGDIGNRMNGHVAIYIGGGQVIAEPHTGTVAQIQDWSHRPITAIRRYV